jgi:TRAP-type C4-dicarboxylate transport system substrate-binding protein
MYTWSKKQVNSLNDLKGQKLGLTPVWFAFAEALGCVPVLMFEPDLYTGLSRGVIDGYMCPPDSVTSLGLQTETKSLIDQSFWEPCNGVFIMNWAKWDSLPGDLKNLINEIMPQLEVDLGTYYGNALEQEKQKAIAAGVKPVKLSPEETQKYLDLANKVVWDKTKEKNSPESYAKLREFLTK